MPKLANATAKAELGRSSWRLLHTMAARFPEEPTQGDRDAFRSFMYLFSRVYPCGECATEFQQLLKRYPPQTSSRQAASLWLCVVHNKVNERLGKNEFDCSQNLEGLYDCGCGGPSGSEDADDSLDKGHKRDVAHDQEQDTTARQWRSLQDSFDRQGRRVDPVTGVRLVGG
ncbi:hypothetical protein ACM66B_000745 [Microbotryomycetes sp. NB124-2]